MQLNIFQKNITKETFKELSSPVKETILNVSSEEIDKIIDSMDKRITAVLKGRVKGFGGSKHTLKLLTKCINYWIFIKHCNCNILNINLSNINNTMKFIN